MLAIAPAAYAETRTFDLASQDAAQAIPEFARQAGLQIIAPADQLKGLTTPAIRGEQDVRAALRRLLAGTGLIIAADDGDVITLRRSEKAENGAPGGAARMSPAAGRALPAAAMSEVIVTATKTGATNLQKTPLTVSVVSGPDLVKRGAANVMGLPELVPSLKVTLNSINPQIYIRGVGGFQGQESEVSVYVDDIYIARLSTIMESNFTDLDRVEVIEGPQGTLFGRNSTGGAINFISKTPSKAFRFDNSLSLGNYSLIDQAATVSGPVSETVQASFSARYYKHDGYQKNIVAGVGNPGAADRFSARGQLRWEATRDIADTLRADYLFADEPFGSNVLRLATPYPTIANTIVGQYDKIANDTLAHATEIVYGLSNELNWRFSDSNPSPPRAPITAPICRTATALKSPSPSPAKAIIWNTR